MHVLLHDGGHEHREFFFDKSLNFTLIRTFKHQVKDGKLQKDGLIGMVDKMFSGDAAMKAAAAELYDECHSAEGGEPCESASNIGTCLKTNGQKKKLSFGI